jgi:hypothetical protein
MQTKLTKIISWMVLFVVLNYILDAIHRQTIQPRWRSILAGAATGLVIGLLLTSNRRRRQSGQLE